MSDKISKRGRVIMGINTFFCLAVTYSQRQNVNVVVSEIVTISNDPAIPIKWTKFQKSVALMSFYAGYLFTQVIGGYLAEKYGPKITLLISIGVSTLSCVITPFALVKSPYILVAARILMGIAQGFFLPCFMVIIANWYPPNYRATAIGLIFPGTFFGTILSLTITSGMAYDVTFWKNTFYIFGAFGVLWMIFWVIFTTDDPRDNRWIKQEEKDFLNNTVEREQISNFKELPVMQMLKSLPVWAIVICSFASVWSIFLIVTIIPSLIKDLYYVQVKDQAYITFLTPVVTWAGGLSSCILADFIQNRKIVSKIRMRKIFNIFSLFPVGIFLMLSTLITKDNLYVGILFILIACYSSGLEISITLANIGDIAPQYYGIIAGIANTMSSAAGLISIQTTYVIVSDTHNSREWQYVFAIMLAVETLGFVAFNTLAKGDIQPWALKNTETLPFIKFNDS